MSNNNSWKIKKERFMAETKYSQYISNDPVKMANIKQRQLFPMISAREEIWPGVEGINCNFAFVCVSEPYLMPDPPHKHDFDEYLFFIGGNPQNLGDLGAEIEVALGEEWEKYLITAPAIVYIPKGLLHCPIHVKKVDKPFLFGHVMPSAAYVKL
jgi:hypothetical protein